MDLRATNCWTHIAVSGLFSKTANKWTITINYIDQCSHKIMDSVWGCEICREIRDPALPLFTRMNQVNRQVQTYPWMCFICCQIKQTSDVWFQLVVLCNYGDYVANVSETYISTACLNLSLLQRISLYPWCSLGGKTDQIYNFSNMSTAVLRHLFNNVTNKENLPSRFEQQRENILQCQLWCLSIEGSVLFCAVFNFQPCQKPTQQNQWPLWYLLTLNKQLSSTILKKKSSMYLYSLQHALPLSCDKDKFFTDWCHFHISLVFF